MNYRTFSRNPRTRGKSHHHQREEALDDLSAKGRKSFLVRQTNTGTAAKITLGKSSDRRSGAHMGFSQRVNTILNGIGLSATRWHRLSCPVQGIATASHHVPHNPMV